MPCLLVFPKQKRPLRSTPGVFAKNGGNVRARSPIPGRSTTLRTTESAKNSYGLAGDVVREINNANAVECLLHKDSAPFSQTRKGEYLTGGSTKSR